MTLAWQTDEELFALAERELFPAVIGDVMDHMGLLRQFLPACIQPLNPGMRVIGRAMTVLTADLPEGAGEAESYAPFGLMLEALDDLKSNEVYLCAGSSPTYALWGELMSTRARLLGAAGAVMDGYYRDSDGIEQLGFPTFGHGAYAQDQGPRGTVVDYRSRIEIGQVTINPGDVVVGDRDGVCIVPRDHEDEVFVRALEKARGEKTVRREIEGGMPAQEAFRKYGIM